MPRVLKREAAERDLVQQWVWYAETASVEVAVSSGNISEVTARELRRQ